MANGYANPVVWVFIRELDGPKTPPREREMWTTYRLLRMRDAFFQADTPVKALTFLNDCKDFDSGKVLPWLRFEAVREYFSQISLRVPGDNPQIPAPYMQSPHQIYDPPEWVIRDDKDSASGISANRYCFNALHALHHADITWKAWQVEASSDAVTVSSSLPRATRAVRDSVPTNAATGLRSGNVGRGNAKARMPLTRKQKG